ncbi:Ribonuclease Z [Paraliobacillus sp. PM-2]|uniref:ribonuclease Z n=1 Tax=Paraliobacillus sp. PM-2 TaxID=1462524 RepID=UPI00061BFD0D|nr:ribonuclease Z [Paraliobacillus sp. PM-2]CQR46757.1 Ribonuclease Z [Paraliobacillus sp. PM-2]
MKLTFLGTGAGVPSKERNVSAILLDLLQERGTTWLFDCGESTQHQILHTTIKPRKVENIFITHLHGDHIYGLPGFLSSRSFQDGTTPVTIYGPKGIEHFVRTSLEISETHLRYPLYFKEVNEGMILEDSDFIVYAKKLEHGIPCYGYRIEQKDKPGELLANKLQAMGISPGPIYQQIKENETTILPNGQVIQRTDVLGADKEGNIITILGDTRYNESLIDFVKNSDVLVHEATFAKDEKVLAHDYFHATTEQAAYIANQANVKQLLLTHISSRYSGDKSEQLQTEAATIFSNVEVANDFFEYEVKK